jgi:dTDP-4-dehydrorhamnose reductase
MTCQRVAIFGSTGQLGTDLVAALRESSRFEVIPLTHEDADVADAEAVRKPLMAIRPQIVVNSAAFVRVDDCEDRADEAFHVNAVGALNIARSCAEIDALCVYVSTDYVFDGAKNSAYLESDTPSPINVYGASKLAGEYLVRQAASHFLIVRVASLFGKTGARGKGGNFIETILAKARRGESLRVIDDMRISPTYTRDAAKIVRQLLQENCTGIVHAANRGSCTWYEFARAALDLAGLAASIEPVPSTAYPTRARRPINSALRSELTDTGRFQGSADWQDALCRYLADSTAKADNVAQPN